MQRTLLVTLASAGALAVAVASTTFGSTAAPTQALGADQARAEIVDPTGATVGFAYFTEDAAGRVHVNVKVAGLTAGEHGIHVHGVAACTPTFADAGGHHNPLGRLHGEHAGDLPNLVVNVEGRGQLEATVNGLTLSAGPTTVFDTDGSAIVIHALPDDYVTQPTGNSGARVACGVIIPT